MNEFESFFIHLKQQYRHCPIGNLDSLRQTSKIMGKITEILKVNIQVYFHSSYKRM